MILAGLGANLPAPDGRSPRETCEAALAALSAAGVTVLRRSRWYRSAPVPASDQPWFINGVAALETDLGPERLLDLLHRIEHALGRVRSTPNAARTLDLDLLAYHGVVSGGPPRLPHPRLHERAFVLLPLREVCPDWRHPEHGASVESMIAALGPDLGSVKVDC
ncbi:MAG: 2-amino-4-hydroxy-6-hydroxymethyldihydropteridine diphosphokinase [Alphaproteobacteria bacterium]|nr:2-amino-4-hydroxy-6-hydroxymethyldihydropteridine diphosphokinase [Alphaproteobacteria bacterium]